jgi:hypothetical protein
VHSEQKWIQRLNSYPTTIFLSNGYILTHLVVGETAALRAPDLKKPLNGVLSVYHPREAAEEEKTVAYSRWIQ